MRELLDDHIINHMLKLITWLWPRYAGPRYARNPVPLGRYHTLSLMTRADPLTWFRYLRPPTSQKNSTPSSHDGTFIESTVTAVVCDTYPMIVCR
ncbi:Endoglucanase EG-II [Fusarium oxysporum f. sp. albedinis]|nr:Endoglucanase EG-II [Fusarium oxysporum f. sp. albedinis]